jgi:DNA mismatch repair protein MutL
MSIKIHALSDIVINQIAAGEVIERPASVVKELVENALDAGANEIRIAIESGGKDLIRISDNGSGMDPEDLELCPLRHTTSKLRSTDDFLKIATNGFRGEAVASIASISKLRIETRSESAEIGHALLIEGGHVEGRETVVRPVGTQFLVQNLFFNTPVRRTFLGSDSLETAKISDVVTRIALAHADKRFELKQGNRELFAGAPGSLRDRVAETLGVGLAKQMIAFDHSEGLIRVHGFVTSPDETRGRRNLQYFFLGKRPIFNSVIAKAVQRAYEPYGKAGYPVVVLFLEMQGTEYDVNVHPAKREVRFSNENQVFLAVHHALRSALMNAGDNSLIVLPEIHSLAPKIEDAVRNDSPKIVETATPIAMSLPETRYVPVQIQPQVVATPERPRWDAKPVARPAETQDLFSQPEYGKVVPLSPKLFQSPSGNKPMRIDSASSVRFLQWSKTYIICEDSQGMLIIDQNAASQRILYEQALQILEHGKGVEAQELLFPEILEMTRQEIELLREHTEGLSKLGFHLEPFGGGSFHLRSIPIHLPISRAETALRDFLHQIIKPIGQDSTGPREALAKAFAHGSAIQAGLALGAEEMSALLEGLVLTQEPYVSPYGRPTLFRLPLDEIHRKFRRIDSST